MSNLEKYDKIISKCDRFERKGKTMPYTSANGYMFSLVNKDDEVGIRFSKEKQKEYLDKFNTSLFKSYGATMQGYILISSEMLDDESLIIELLNESYDYVMSLKKK